ncbi:Annexin_9 [Hexamita inflata]|uniref:Annexin 9 n=1 Tax=Hexamita inflata TaxID=28002 RepID=A0AA86NKU3_9EUKA|nr:Annexin 9 [Hexamita inflata]
MQKPDLRWQGYMLKHAMMGVGTKKQEIVDIILKHNQYQRVVIAEQFQSEQNLNLKEELKKELSGSLLLLFSNAFEERYTFWAEQVHEAIKGAVKNEKNLIQLVLLMNDYDIQQVSLAYNTLFRRDLHEQICDEISNIEWAKLLKAWLRRDNNIIYDPNTAADELFQAAKGAGKDEGVFIRILSTSNPENFQQICEYYQSKYGHTIYQSIEKEFTGLSEFAFLLAHEFLTNPAEAVAFVLNQSMKGTGTNDTILIAVTLLYSELYKGETIKRAYIRFGDIKKDFKKDLTGKYEDTVLGLWGL